MYDKIGAYLTATIAWVETYARIAFDWLDQMRLLTSTQAELVIFFTALVMLPMIQIWLRHREVRKWKTACASIAPVMLLIPLLLTPSGFVGTPDENCAKYDDGNRVYTLIGLPLLVPKSADDLYGEDLLLLNVKAPKAWGNQPHECILNFENPKTKVLAEQLAADQNNQVPGYSRSKVTFTFGGRNEKPNVTIRSLGDEKKTAPPEMPKPKQDI